MTPVLRLFSPEVFPEPFPYIVSPASLDLAVSCRILTWLESEAPWRLVETDFYEQFEFSLLDGQLPPDLAFLRSSDFLVAAKARMASLFGATLGERIDATAHRLVPGQRIRLHNDFITGAETHRLLIQLNRGWKDENGGFLLFFNSTCSDLRTSGVELENIAVFGSDYLRTKRPLGSHYLRMSAYYLRRAHLVENDAEVVRTDDGRHNASPTARIRSASSRVRPASSWPLRKRRISLGLAWN